MCVRAVCHCNNIYIWPWSVQTWGLPSQFKGAKEARRLNKSPLSHGLHEDLDEPKAEPPALVLMEVHGGCEPTHDREAALEPCPWLDPSMLPTFIGTVGEDAPAELINEWAIGHLRKFIKLTTSSQDNWMFNKNTLTYHLYPYIIPFPYMHQVQIHKKFKKLSILHQGDGIHENLSSSVW
jgi:hypothetical protein